jgi:hypothetical protein
MQTLMLWVRDSSPFPSQARTDPPSTEASPLACVPPQTDEPIRDDREIRLRLEDATGRGR